MAGLAEELLTGFNVEQVLRRLCERLPRVLPVDGAAVSLLHEDRLLYAEATTVEFAMAERAQADLGEGPCFEAVLSAEAVQVPDLRVETRWRRFTSAALAAGVAAVTSLPMAARGRIWGAVELYSRAPLLLNAEDLAAARLLTHVATNYILHARDRESRQAAEDALRVQTMHDPLTGLPNRVLLLDRLSLALAAASRSSKALAVLFVDLDRFKQVNDTFGHAAGDRLLIGVADALQSVLRPGDTLARLAGDEFVVLAGDQHPTRRPSGTATGLARRLLAALDRPIRIDGHPVCIAASIGIAYAEPGDTPESLLHAADTAMYEAKEGGSRGGERIAVADRRRPTGAPSLLQWESELSTALEGGQLRLHYQPVLDLRSGAVAGAEALIRWQHPVRGLLTPAAFLPAAEVTGQITALGRWVTNAACRSLHAADTALPAAGFRLAVNASPRELHHPEFVTSLRQAMSAADVDPHRLCVEVTEASLISDLGEISAVLQQIRDLGVRVAVDDFGTGFSSLAYLHRLPVDTLKIDQSFVKTMTTTSAGDVIVAHVIGLAHSLGLSVTAEGIETSHQQQRLHDLGCDHGQGYALGRPRPTLTVA
ncbi:diguanylate cyclase (GGDEF)-like protein [Kineococcus xinjiangensis]|uniref:Diguanylate cyclase (GGDEF)-like protein n=2 Tax=Kineococcus xinjiangensis TaxID=512762 RepID=A0A2S6ICC5_9ACTN|nr:diguanylate cyclase (GGDEF)-like protein [Kineococcus xinjiangensis]